MGAGAACPSSPAGVEAELHPYSAAAPATVGAAERLNCLMTPMVEGVVHRHSLAPEPTEGAQLWVHHLAAPTEALSSTPASKMAAVDSVLHLQVALRECPSNSAVYQVGVHPKAASQAVARSSTHNVHYHDTHEPLTLGGGAGRGGSKRGFGTAASTPARFDGGPSPNSAINDRYCRPSHWSRSEKKKKVAHLTVHFRLLSGGLIMQRSE